MKKRLLHISLLILSILAFNLLYSQDDYSREKDKPEKPKPEKKKKPSKDNDESKFVFGGGIGLQLGNPIYIELSPKIGYHLTEKTLVGGGITYIYYAENTPQYGKLQTSIYGGSIFGSYEPIDNLFGWVEYELLNNQYYNINGDLTRKWIASPFIGIGYRQEIGEKSFVQLMLLYNLNYNNEDYSPYNGPFVPRISFFF
jgi:hypothetical protein